MARKRFTHFVDHSDGSGDYRAYSNMSTVLRAHSKAIKQPDVMRSWIKDYGSGGIDYKIVADWHAPRETIEGVL